VTSPAVRPNDTATVTATMTSTGIAVKPDVTSSDRARLNACSTDIDHVMQRTMDIRKTDTRVDNNSTVPSPFNPDDDFILADILQRSEIDQQNILLRCIGIDLEHF
jgi:hypothetical protein